VSEPGKGKFSADISPKVIEEALQSVAKSPSAGGTDAGAEAVSAQGEVAPTGVSGEIEELRSQLTLSQEKGRETMARLQEVHERMLRAVADLENYRKRAQREKEQMQKFGTEKILADLLPVLDNLERGLEHSNSSADFTSLMRGVSMTRKLFEDTLAKYGVRPISASGHAFDPNLHEAIQHVESEEIAANWVVSEAVQGYTLNDRLLRPALVVVSKGPPRGAVNLPTTGNEAPVDTPDPPKGGSGDET
jgi:molecular chaperone GrpE